MWDSLILARSVYESYLQLAFILNPNNAIDIENFALSRIRLDAGECSFINKNGKILYDKIIDSDGNMYTISNNFKQYAINSFNQLDFDVFNNIYSLLSQISHNDFRMILRYIDWKRNLFSTKEKFDILTGEYIIISIYLAYFDILLSYNDIEIEERDNILFTLNNVKKHLKDHNRDFVISDRSLKIHKILLKRVNLIKVNSIKILW